jgi:hypothetical protein
MSDNDLNKAARLFASSLDECVRPRLFYALRKGTAERYSMLTLVTKGLPVFVAYALGRRGTEPASAAEVASYKETVASAEFIAWREREEALRRSAK